MKKGVLLGISMGLLLLVAAEGADNFFDGNSTPDQLWSSAANWSLGHVPTAADRVCYNLQGGQAMKIANGTVAVAANLVIAADNTDLEAGDLRLIQNGARSSLTVGGRMFLGNDAGGRGKFVLNGGTVTVNSGAAQHGSVFVGNAGQGTLVVRGGTFNTSSALCIGLQAGSVGTLTMTGGEINLGDQSAQGMNLVMYRGLSGPGSKSHVQLDGGTLRAFRIENMIHADADATIDFAGGTMVVTGKRITETANYIKAGVVGSYGHYLVKGDVVSEYFMLTYDGAKTTIVAVPPKKAMVFEGGVYPSSMTMMKLGEIKPAGWIFNQIDEDLREGYIGYYDKISAMSCQDVFGANKADYDQPRPPMTAKPWWCGEVEAHRFDALCRMAFLTDNKEYQEVVRGWADNILAHRGEDGYIGMYKPELALKHKTANGEFWAMSRALMVLMAYSEYSGDETYMDAAKKAVRLVMSTYGPENEYFWCGNHGGYTHGPAFVDVLEWLYRITGDREYAEFAEHIFENFGAAFATTLGYEITEVNLLDRDLPFKLHGAHLTEQFMIPFFLSALYPDAVYGKCADNAMDKMRFHFAPGGGINSYEAVDEKRGSADCVKEYCTTHELQRALNRISMITGNMEAADWVEIIAHNAAPAGRMHPLTAVQYCSSDNRIEIDGSRYGGRQQYAVCHNAAVCCAMSAARFMPYFVEGMWMRRTDYPALIAMQYGPSTLKTQVGGTAVTIKEETDYPFSDLVRFVVDVEKAVEFTLYLRRPSGNSSMLIKQEQLPGAVIVEGRDYVTIKKLWEAGDVVDLDFNFVVEKMIHPESETVQGSQGGIYLKRGPLVFALPFEADLDVVRTYEFDGRKFNNYKVVTKGRKGWDYAIDPSEEFELVTAEDSEIKSPWINSPVYLKGRLVDPQGNRVEVKLVPEGSTILRRVAFPVQSER